LNKGKLPSPYFFTTIQFYQLWCCSSYSTFFLQSCPGTAAATSLGRGDKGRRLMLLRAVPLWLGFVHMARHIQPGVKGSRSSTLHAARFLLPFVYIQKMVILRISVACQILAAFLFNSESSKYMLNWIMLTEDEIRNNVVILWLACGYFFPITFTLIFF
jgi:hypothetical protein